MAFFQLIVVCNDLNIAELEFVNWNKISETMFDIMDTNRTGRPEYDNMNPTTTTAMQVRYV